MAKSGASDQVQKSASQEDPIGAIPFVNLCPTNCQGLLIGTQDHAILLQLPHLRAGEEQGVRFVDLDLYWTICRDAAGKLHIKRLYNPVLVPGHQNLQLRMFR